MTIPESIITLLLGSKPEFHLSAGNLDSLSFGFVAMGLAVYSNCGFHLGFSLTPQFILNAYSKGPILLQKISICILNFI